MIRSKFYRKPNLLYQLYVTAIAVAVNQYKVANFTGFYLNKSTSESSKRKCFCNLIIGEVTFCSSVMLYIREVQKVHQSLTMKVCYSSETRHTLNLFFSDNYCIVSWKRLLCCWGSWEKIRSKQTGRPTKKALLHQENSPVH